MESLQLTRHRDCRGAEMAPPEQPGLEGMATSSCYLSKHSFFCLADNQYVFLDLRNDAYLCLDGRHTDDLGKLLGVHQAIDIRTPGSGPHDGKGTSESAAVQVLIRKGILVQSENQGKPPVPERTIMPLTSTMDKVDGHRTRIGAKHVWHFLSSASIASLELRSGSIERNVQKIAERKAAQTMNSTELYSDAIGDLFQIFQTLRPIYPRRYLCLFDSLALLHFLARYRQFPRWVYGVKLKPFRAHCWVQAGDVVVNDIVDNVRGYTPIMSV